MSATRTMVWRYFMATSYRAHVGPARMRLRAGAFTRRLLAMNRLSSFSRRAVRLVVLAACGIVAIACAQTARQEGADVASQSAVPAAQPVDGRVLGAEGAPVVI